MNKTNLKGLSAFLIPTIIAAPLCFTTAQAEERGAAARVATIPSFCGEAAQTNGSKNIKFRKPGNIGKFWCASTDREGTLLAVRSSGV